MLREAIFKEEKKVHFDEICDIVKNNEKLSRVDLHYCGDNRRGDIKIGEMAGYSEVYTKIVKTFVSLL